jgi:hypothetical protein
VRGNLGPRPPRPTLEPLLAKKTPTARVGNHPRSSPPSLSPQWSVTTVKKGQRDTCPVQSVSGVTTSDQAILAVSPVAGASLRCLNCAEGLATRGSRWQCGAVTRARQAGSSLPPAPLPGGQGGTQGAPPVPGIPLQGTKSLHNWGPGISLCAALGLL